jgi:hypothetical protein
MELCEKLIKQYHEGFDKIAELAEALCQQSGCNDQTVKSLALVTRSMQAQYALVKQPQVVNGVNRYEPKRRELETGDTAYRPASDDGQPGRYKQTAFEKEAAEPTSASRYPDRPERPR